MLFHLVLAKRVVVHACSLVELLVRVVDEGKNCSYNIYCLLHVHVQLLLLSW